MAQPAAIEDGATYEIHFQDRLEGEWSAWLNGLVNTREVCQGESLVTCLTVRVPDQAALRGVLNRLWDLNLTLTCVRIIPAIPDKETDHDR